MINRKTLESLVHSGSFDEFGEDRAVLLASLDVAIDHAQLIRPSDSNQYDLFAEEEFFQNQNMFKWTRFLKLKNYLLRRSTGDIPFKSSGFHF